MTRTSFSLARRLRAGETVHTAWCMLPSPTVTEFVAREGFPAVLIDLQHGMMDLAAALDAVGLVRLAGAAPAVRIPVGDFATASRVLDFGAEGVIAPMINTAADAAAFAAAVKYPPVGARSWGPLRAAPLAGYADPKDYLAAANAETVSFAMIETRGALANVDAIAATPGIDALFVGPSDLSIVLSDGASLDQSSPAVVAELAGVVAAAERAGKIAGIYCSNADRAAEMGRLGFRYIAVGSDLGFLRAGAAAAAKFARGG